MQAPKIPLDEDERLRALRASRLLDTPPSEDFDRITRLAAKALQVPILLISLVDEKRQWFKSRVGLTATQTAREISFCGHTVFERRPLLIPDALLDARFAHNPLVIGFPYIRAYAGIPLYAHGVQPIGTICAIDARPRHFGDTEMLDLSNFAKLTEELIHIRQLTAN